MNRRDLFRTTLLGTIGVAATAPVTPALEFPPGQDAAKELERPDWKPVFLDGHQNETLVALSEVIIPTTDTPGAKAALVNRFLDLLMSVEKAETQRAFLAALSYIDGACMERYQCAFRYLAAEQQIEFLNLLAYPHTHETWGEEAQAFPGYDHFSKLKQSISDAYYSSPIGLKEIGWDGTFPHGVFSGCGHSANEYPEHKNH